MRPGWYSQPTPGPVSLLRDVAAHHGAQPTPRAAATRRQLEPGPDLDVREAGCEQHPLDARLAQHPPLELVDPVELRQCAPTAEAEPLYGVAQDPAAAADRAD